MQTRVCQQPQHMLGRPSGTRRILQPLQAFGRKTPAPLADRDFRNAQRGGDLLIGLAVAAAKIIRLRKANPCGADGDRTQWSNVAFVIVLSSITAGVLGMSPILPELADNIRNYLDDGLVGCNIEIGIAGNPSP